MIPRSTAFSVYPEALLSILGRKLATPAAGVPVRVPESVPPPGLDPSEMVIGAVHHATSAAPEPSRTATVTGAPVGR